MSVDEEAELEHMERLADTYMKASHAYAAHKDKLTRLEEKAIANKQAMCSNYSKSATTRLGTCAQSGLLENEKRRVIEWRALSVNYQANKEAERNKMARVAVRIRQLRSPLA